MKRQRISPLKSSYTKKFVKAHNKKTSHPSGTPIRLIPFINSKLKKINTGK